MIKEIAKGISLMIGNVIPGVSDLNRFRRPFYRMAGMKIGHDTIIVGPVSMPADMDGFVEIGHHTYLNALSRFSPNRSGIRIGNHCLIGPRVSFECGGHHIIYDEVNGRGCTSKKIEIQDRVWIGASATILQGVTIGRQSVIAAGAVVTCNIPPNTVWGGVPAKQIRKIKT